MISRRMFTPISPLLSPTYLNLMKGNEGHSGVDNREWEREW